MPIYAYKCSACGFAKDVLQKLSDAPLTRCPNCGAERFGKQVTAAGFQLKGSGWYVTDFRDGGGKKPSDKQEAKESDGAAKGADTAAEKAGDGAAGKAQPTASPAVGGEGKPAAAPAPSPAPAPAPSKD